MVYPLKNNPKLALIIHVAFVTGLPLIQPSCSLLIFSNSLVSLLQNLTILFPPGLVVLLKMFRELSVARNSPLLSSTDFMQLVLQMRAVSPHSVQCTLYNVHCTLYIVLFQTVRDPVMA